MKIELMMLADLLLISGALGAGFYCFVLSRRLRKFTDLEKGVGGAVAVLAVQVDDLEKSLSAAKSTAAQSVQTLSDVTGRAEKSAHRLELLIASLHDLAPEVPTRPAKPAAKPDPFFVRDAQNLAPAE